MHDRFFWPKDALPGLGTPTILESSVKLEELRVAGGVRVVGVGHSNEVEAVVSELSLPVEDRAMPRVGIAVGRAARDDRNASARSGERKRSRAEINLSRESIL